MSWLPVLKNENRISVMCVLLFKAGGCARKRPFAVMNCTPDEGVWGGAELLANRALGPCC